MGEIRIIGGRCRGTKLKVPDRVDLRPTSNRIRETLFNWLLPVSQGARCLDLFAGSGALGIEALSRGAAEVFFVEQHRETAGELQAHLTRLKFENASVFIGDALYFIPRWTQAFEVIFLDPPFKSNLLNQALTALAESSCLAKDTLIYREYDIHFALDPLPERFNIYRHRTTSQIVYELLQCKF